VPDKVTMAEADYRGLPIWDGIYPDDEPGTQYQAAYRGRDYLVTVKAHADGAGLYSSSEEVELT
jgi:hypothetical protein